MFAHKARIRAFHPGDVREDIAPQVVVIPLLRDEAGSVQAEPGASVNRGAGGLAEHHGHRPLHEDDVFAAGNGSDVHLEFLAALGEAIAHCHESGLTHYALDRVLEDNVFRVVRKNVGPIGFAAGVVGARPEREHKLLCEGRERGGGGEVFRSHHGSILK